MAEKIDTRLARLKILVLAATGAYIALFLVMSMVSWALWGPGALVVVLTLLLMPFLIGSIVRVVRGTPGIERTLEPDRLRRVRLLWLASVCVLPLAFLGLYLAEAPRMLFLAFALFLVAIVIGGLPVFFPIGRKGRTYG